MKILGIESASLVASAALLEDDVLLSECTSNYKKTHSETLLPMIEEVLRTAGTEPSGIDLIAVSEGPGSFTGLRIGVSTAKGMAYALNVPVVPVPTTDAMAYGCYGSQFILCPLMDARREQVYTGIYEFRGEDFTVLHPADALALTEAVSLAEEFSEKLNKPVCYLGDGLKVFEEKILSISRTKPVFAPASNRFQRASSVASLGFKLFKEGRQESAETFLPVYLRKSQAEREREAMGLSTEAAELF